MSKGESPTVELSALIDTINERFGTDFTPADGLFFKQIRKEPVADDSIRQAVIANTTENFRYVFNRALEGLFIDRMGQNEDLFARFMHYRTSEGSFRGTSTETFANIRGEAIETVSRRWAIAVAVSGLRT